MKAVYSRNSVYSRKIMPDNSFSSEGPAYRQSFRLTDPDEILADVSYTILIYPFGGWGRGEEGINVAYTTTTTIFLKQDVHSSTPPLRKVTFPYKTLKAKKKVLTSWCSLSYSVLSCIDHEKLFHLCFVSPAKHLYKPGSYVLRVLKWWCHNNDFSEIMGFI